MTKTWLPFKRDENGNGSDGVGSLLRFTAIAVVVAIAIIAIGEASRSRDASRAVAPATATHDPLAAELARCRGVTPEQLAIDDSCRRVWAENRRRFFAPTAPAARATDTPSKTQDRISTSVTPLSSDELR
jgi:conjugative transfer region protein TrbK